MTLNAKTHECLDYRELEKWLSLCLSIGSSRPALTRTRCLRARQHYPPHNDPDLLVVYGGGSQILELGHQRYGEKVVEEERRSRVFG